MDLLMLIIEILLGVVFVIGLVVIQDERRIEAEAELRRCTETDCYFNDDLMCRSLSDTWNPELLDNCPDYTED